MTDRYAVIGNPVAHSKSPFIHAEFARQTGQDLRYEALLAPLDGFAQAVDAFRRSGGKGLNVTLPFTLEAFRLAQDLSARAQLAQAVNTLKFEGDACFGDNTDGVGLTRDIVHNLGCAVAARRLLLMGAGGAARGVIGPLLEQHPACLTVVNRTPEKGYQLARQFAQLGPIAATSYPELAGSQFDLIINATSSSLTEDMPPLPTGVFAPGALAYDMMYSKHPSPFLRFASQAGARVADGLGMLVEQAAESFYIWRGVRPDSQPVLALLRAGSV